MRSTRVADGERCPDPRRERIAQPRPLDEGEKERKAVVQEDGARQRQAAIG